jgi:hypothetical protein
VVNLGSIDMCSDAILGELRGLYREWARIGAYAYHCSSALERRWRMICICTNSGPLPEQVQEFAQNRITAHIDVTQNLHMAAGVKSVHSKSGSTFEALQFGHSQLQR